MEELISVIVPVYNVAPYLTDCVKSVQQQTVSHWELILVEDGSTDASGSLCDRLAETDERIRVIHKSNAGVSAARNDGIEAAKGDYIAFLDGDDLLHPQYLELLLEGIRQTGAELSICGFQCFTDGQALPDCSPIESAAFQRVERRALLSALFDPGSVESQCMVIPCVKLCRKSCFESLRFPEGVRHEDEFLVHHLLMGCSCAAVSRVPLYFYRRHPDSFMGLGEVNHDLRHLVYFEALTDRIALFARQEPELVSDAVHTYSRQAGEYFEDYAHRREPVYRQKLRWLLRLYRQSYLRYFHLLRTKERLKGLVFLFAPVLYYRLGQWRWKRRNE